MPGFFSLWPMKSAFKCWSACLATTAFDILTSCKSVCVLPLTSIQLEIFLNVLELIACYLLPAMTGQFLFYQRGWNILDVPAKIFNQSNAKILFFLIEYCFSPLPGKYHYLLSCVKIYPLSIDIKQLCETKSFVYGKKAKANDCILNCLSQ